MRSVARWITSVNRVLATAAGLITALIMVISCLEIASRGVLNFSIPGASETTILLLLALVFLGFAGAESKGENYSVTILVQTLRPGTRRVLRTIASLASLLAVTLMAWFSWSRGIAATLAGEASYGVISYPVWPSRLLIAFGFTMLALQLVAGMLNDYLATPTKRAAQ